MYIKWKLAQQSRSPSWGTIKSRTTINRGFSPAGTEEWALLKTPEEHMLRHSLLRPQMFLNSWFPQVAFPFSPRYCANYFSARSTWVACCSDCASSAPFFFFFFSPPYPRSTQHKDRWISGPAVRHIGSSTLLTVLKCLWELMEHFSCSSLSQPNPICAEQISCGVALTVVLFRQIHIYKKIKSLFVLPV